MNVEAKTNQHTNYDNNKTHECDVSRFQQLAVHTGLKDRLYYRLKHGVDRLLLKCE